MSQFTYEKTDKQEQYETFEWDNVWIDHANDTTSGRVLYIGDSISCGTRHVATRRAGERILFDGFGTSKALDNPYFKDALSLFIRQQGRRDAVIFNNGLHGWHLDDDTAYKRHYEDMVRFLLEQFPDTPVAVVLTTYITNEQRHARVQRRNAAAVAIAEKYGLPVIDLYTVSHQAADLLSPDGVHFTQPGYEQLADAIIAAVKTLAPQIVTE